MALIHSFESSGNFLFKNRSFIPVILFVLAVPVVYLTNYAFANYILQTGITIFAILLSLAGLIVRAITIGTTPAGTSGRNTKEGQVAEELNTGGIYSVIRHPLYLGNYLMWIGIVIFTFNIYFIIIVSLAYWLYYERIMFAEERFLEKKFGKPYLDWSMTAPAFIPSFKNYRKSNLVFSIKSVFRREYSGVLATVFGFAFIDNLRIFLEYQQFDPSRISNIVLACTGLAAFILRTLKHHTTVLHEKGRS
ncbi:MAG: isoprenylcysteine carboxylmethyltransferase family protein [Bacteroidales bacterium]|nr:isoprenylcysteine carboxylmethyltransferase family protein [Bacteroidales bacterium]